MSRRIVPGTFWIGILACALLLLLAGTMRASNPSHRPPEVRGIWDGFFLAADGTLGGAQSDITQQDFRRLAGDGVLFDLESAELFNAYNFSATMPRDDFITGTGVTRPGRLVFQADLGPFAGVGGDAVMAPEYRFVPSRGDESRISALLLLHPFPSVAPPDIAGSYVGPDPTFMGIVTMQISSRSDRGTFAGRVEIFPHPDQPPLISWPSLATTSDDRRLIWISQGGKGRIIYDGVVVPAPENTVDRIDGVFRLQFNDGRSLFNAWNCALVR